MKAKGWGPATLAAVAQIPVSTVMRIINGEVKDPSTDTCISIAKALKVRLVSLLVSPKE